jgi:hypothetical protein
MSWNLRNLRCLKISIRRVSAEEYEVLSKPGGERGGTMSLYARVSVTGFTSTRFSCSF